MPTVSLGSFTVVLFAFENTPKRKRMVRKLIEDDVFKRLEKQRDVLCMGMQ